MYFPVKLLSQLSLEVAGSLDTIAAVLRRLLAPLESLKSRDSVDFSPSVSSRLNVSLPYSSLLVSFRKKEGDKFSNTGIKESSFQKTTFEL